MLLSCGMSNTETFELPDGGKVELRPVTDNDDQFLLSIYASTREQELSQAEWAEGQKEMFLRWQFDLQRQEYSARFPDAAYHVILVDGSRAGRIWVGSDDEQIRLLDIALLPEFQNRGVGTALLRRLMDQAAKAGKALAAALPNSRTVVLPGAGHMMMVERPDELLAALQG